jgi:recombinational DNA repair protein RecT
VMTRREVEKHRDRSATRGSGPWVTDYEAMALKTVLRKLCKFLPASVELKRAVELDERAEAGLPQDLPSIDAEYTEESEPPAPDGEGEGPPTQHAPESDAPAPDSTRTGAGSTGNPSGAGGTTVCNGCGRAHSLIEGDGGAPGIGHAPNCPERHV